MRKLAPPGSGHQPPHQAAPAGERQLRLGAGGVAGGPFVDQPRDLGHTVAAQREIDPAHRDARVFVHQRGGQAPGGGGGQRVVGARAARALHARGHHPQPRGLGALGRRGARGQRACHRQEIGRAVLRLVHHALHAGVPGLRRPAPDPVGGVGRCVGRPAIRHR
jgi:hypothetical protein